MTTDAEWAKDKTENVAFVVCPRCGSAIYGYAMHLCGFLTPTINDDDLPRFWRMK